MTSELVVHEFEPIVKQSGLDKAELYAATFAPFMITLKELSNKAANINHEAPGALDAKVAREVRLAMAKNRTACEKLKNDNKASLLAEGNLIQNFYNVVANASKLSEADLDAVEKFAENKEKERIAQLATDRAVMFEIYGTDLTGYDLGNMTENVFADLLESQKLLHEKKIAEAARIEAERIAAKKAELERQKAIQAENERLKAEAAEKEKAIEAERKEAARLAKVEADKQAAILKAEQDKADKLAKENAAKLAAIEAENRRVREKAAAELKAAQDAAAKAAKELHDKKDAEDKAAAAKLAAEKKAAKAPIKERMIADINSLQLKVPEFSFYPDIEEKLSGFKKWALQQIEQI